MKSDRLFLTMKKIRWLLGIGVGSGVLCIVSVLFFSDANWVIIGIAAANVLVFVAIFFLLHHTHADYLQSLVSQLSDLTDALVTLEEIPVFSDTEDTLLSKLQSKITKLVFVLRKQKGDTMVEKEKIQSLVSDLSHQLKTPISNLMIYSEFLQDDTLSVQKRKEYLQVIQTALLRLNFLSESMIKISRLESGLIHLHPKVQSCNETALQAIKSAYSKAKEKQIELCYAEEQMQILADHDRNWTAEAIYNLLDNAIKYGAAHTKITLSVKQYGMFSAIEVADQNAPIPEEERSKIFSRFYRGKNSVGKEGIGVGLYLTREIVQKQGGYMTVKCTCFGNHFVMVLPKGNPEF